MDTQHAPDPRTLDALLDFYVAAGVDCALEETPVDRFAETAEQASKARAARPAQPAPAPPAAAQGLKPSFAPSQPSRPSATQPSQPAAPQRPAPPQPSLHHLPDQPVRGFAELHGDEAIDAARALAEGAASLADLRDAVAQFTGCGLRTTAKSLVFADGNPAARVMVVGGAPEREDDIEGRPFTGPAGQLLDRMLAAIALDRSSVYLANTVPWRPPGGREPSAIEADICAPFIRRQIALCNPDVLVCMGGVAAKLLLGLRGPVLKERGQWHAFVVESRQIPAMATLRVSDLLANPAYKKPVWQDLLAIQARLAQAPAS
ncbi:uracil-DNA glycosylase [Breoghania sp. L-A4]|uniref:uracil-DNA glycosylase n=1 Tax=Breoghania sp. L-A4 TaxID=2304600 RepID=UPI000E359C3E|nr:uracil-DNA glycosylase [Breoghania sp. L-A4]AXS42452.1 uracil-DNA glycosylase [Breoghania sp. L-A4]